MSPRKRDLNLVAFTLICSGLFFRFVFLPVLTVDMDSYLLWYNYIAQHGILGTLGSQSFGYNPPFIYLLALASLTKSFLPALWAIKLITIVFDIINSSLVYQIVKSHSKDPNQARWAALIFWIAPTILINSSLWGQTDALYTCFLLLCMLSLFKNRPTLAVIAFSISIAIKAQGIFLAPFLVILFLKKQIPWHTFLLIPLVYVATFVPTFLAGRPIGTLVSTYTAQGETFSRPSMNAPNFYFFLPASAYQISLQLGIPIAGLILVTWVLYSGFKHYKLTRSILMLAALLSVALTPFILPKMHDRYFYPADVFSILVAFLVPGLQLIPILYQIVSLISYAPYLLYLDPVKFIPFAVILNTLALGILLWKQRKMMSHREINLNELREFPVEDEEQGGIQSHPPPAKP